MLCVRKCSNSCHIGGQIGAAVTHTYLNVQDVGSNPAVIRNENGH